MKVKELLELLNDVDPEAEVVLSSDGEGNSFSPCADYSPQYRYEADSTWNGELVSAEDPDEFDEERWNEAVPCVVLWPTN
jgi:hypothetical protein